MHQPRVRAAGQDRSGRPSVPLAPPQQPPYPRAGPSLKRPWLCVLLSVVLPGCGVIAAGSLAFGLVYAILFVALLVTAVVAFLFGLFGVVFFGLDGASRSISRDFEVAFSMVSLFGSPVVLVLAVAPWLASIIHAGLAAREWNRRHAGPLMNRDRQRRTPS